MTSNRTLGFVSMCAAVGGGVLADRFGLKLIAALPRLVVTLLLYPALSLVVSSGSPTVFIDVVACLLVPHAMAGAAGIILIPKIFPAAVRTSGLSISYALGVTIFGGTAQIVFTWIIGATGDKLSWVWYIIAMGLVSLLSTLAIRIPAEWASRPAAALRPGDL